MSVLNVRTDRCRYDLVSLGEVMLRLDPGDGRIHTSRVFQVWEGGGEYNVARGLKRCFGKNTAIVTAIPDCPIGRLLEDLIYQGGVSMQYVRWTPYDGIGRSARVGLNFTERGFGVRSAIGCSDRAYSAASQLKKDDVDWDAIFGGDGARWLHTGGIFAALSATTPEVVLEAVTAAKRHGAMVSYDLNYRPSLWQFNGGQEKARQVNRALAPYVDVMIGNEEDFSAALGFEVEGLDANLSSLDPANFQKMMREVVRTFPNIKVVATTLRQAKTASVNDWGAVAFADGQCHEATFRPNLEIFDRVGGGDSFASGLIYGLLEGKTVPESLNYGVAHGALAMTTPGDTSAASLREVERVMKGGAARVQR
ncbi:MAG: sugar kinase [Thermoguttaceae bacterium]